MKRVKLISTLVHSRIQIFELSTSKLCNPFKINFISHIPYLNIGFDRLRSNFKKNYNSHLVKYSLENLQRHNCTIPLLSLLKKEKEHKYKPNTVGLNSILVKVPP